MQKFPNKHEFLIDGPAGDLEAVLERPPAADLADLAGWDVVAFSHLGSENPRLFLLRLHGLAHEQVDLSQQLKRAKRPKELKGGWLNAPRA